MPFFFLGSSALFKNPPLYYSLLKRYSWSQMRFNKCVFLFCLAVAFLGLSSPFCASARSIDEIQASLDLRETGERIAFWANYFVGTPYDKDPLGEYVTRKAIIADERVDCMYLVFRSVELALSSSPAGAQQTALDKRFHTKGIVDGVAVVNYDDRFQYGEEMIDSGKWGREITGVAGKTAEIRDERRGLEIAYAPVNSLKAGKSRLKSGDLVFFIKRPEKRVYGEVVGHMGVIKVEKGRVLLIHAAGTKKAGGMVRKVGWEDYLRTTPYIGAKITRFD